MRNGVLDLGAPAGIAVGRHVVFLALFRRYRIFKSFNVRFIWLMEVHVDWFLVSRGKQDAIVMSGMDVLEYIEGGLHVSGRWVHQIRG